jgi:hypothetical protein
MVPGLFAVSKEAFKRYPEEWKVFYALRTSKRAYEESAYTSGFSYLIQKPEGNPYSYDARIQGPTKRWVHDTWALGCRITQEAIEDELYGVMKTAMKDLGVSAAATRHLLATRLIMNGENTTYHTAGDGKAIFATDHVKLGGGTWSNKGTAADPTEATLTAAIKAFENITDHRGKKYDQRAKVVWCGPEQEFAFSKLLFSTLEPDTNYNAINAVPKRRKLRLVIDHEITDGRWGLMGNKDSDVGCIWFDRIKPSLSRAGDPDTGDAKFFIRGRWSNEANDPRQIYMVPEGS